MSSLSRKDPSPSGRRIADADRLANKMLGNESVQDQKDDARDEKEEGEGCNVVEFRPKLLPLRAARRLTSQFVRLLKFRQSNDGANRKNKIFII